MRNIVKFILCIVILYGCNSTNKNNNGTHNEMSFNKTKLENNTKEEQTNKIKAQRVDSINIEEKKTNQHPPKFEDYSITTIFHGTPSNIDFMSDPDAKRFKTILRKSVKEGPNFAGHYTIVEWGCGSGCQSHAIVDLENGKVYSYSNLTTSMGINYRLNSSLIVTDPIDTLDNNYLPISYSYYYNWNGNKLILLDSLEIPQ